MCVTVYSLTILSFQEGLSIVCLLLALKEGHDFRLMQNLFAHAKFEALRHEMYYIMNRTFVVMVLIRGWLY